MKYDLTKEDKEKIDNVNKFDPIVKFLRNQEHLKFKVGDILVKMVPARDEEGKMTWRPELVSDVTPIPKKFLYVCENDVGVGFVKSINSSGKPGKGMTPMTDFDINYNRFELDPDIADHILLADEGEVFDAAAAYKQKKKFREKAFKLNRKQMVAMDADIDRIKFLETLKVGDQFWSGRTMDGMVTTKVEVVKISTQLTSYNSRWDKEAWDSMIKENPDLTGVTLKQFTCKIIAHEAPDRIGKLEDDTYRSFDRYITFKPPYKLSEDQ